ncbi:MAG: hypothetical protein JRI56_00270 [Deltaproteobacteria bacterium]|nr:hypothetical protein [Deltaproteobacteria bacterium]
MDMRWTFSDVYKKVSEFLGLGSSPTGDDLTLVKNIVYRGYMKFLMPLNPGDSDIYTWSFLRQEWKLSIVPNKWEYALPGDFERFFRDLEYDAGERLANLKLVSLQTIMSNRNVLEFSSYPEMYAIRTAKFDKSVGSQKELVVYPTPNGSYTINTTYVMTPAKPENDDDYFIGGPLESEVILQCCLAVAENEQDEVIGVETQRAVDMLQALIRKDKGESPNTVGMVYDRNIGFNYDPMFYRRYWIPRGTWTVYGQEI